MYYKYSKLAKIIFLINAVLLVIAVIANGYIMSRLIDTNNNIVRVMEEKQVIRETAIRMLEKDGYEIFEGRGMSAYFGLTMNFLAIFFLIKYVQTNGAFMGFGAGICGVLSTFVGGMLIFYLIFSGKELTKSTKKSFSFRNAWEEFVHNTAVRN